MTEEAREARLPAHITEDDIRLISEIIAPTIAKAGFDAGVVEGIRIAREEARELADAIWVESQQGATIIRDSGIMQDIVERIDLLIGVDPDERRT